MRSQRINLLLTIFMLCTVMRLVVYGQNGKMDILGEEKKRILRNMEEIFDKMPYEYADLNDKKVFELKALSVPEDATMCIELLPELIESGVLNDSSSDSISISRHFCYYLDIFRKNYEPVNPELFYRTAIVFHQKEDNYMYVYYLIDQYMKCSDKTKIDSVLENVLVIMPLKKGNNALILSAVYFSFGDAVYPFIDKVIERNPDKGWLIEELRKDKETLIRNTKKK